MLQQGTGMGVAQAGVVVVVAWVLEVGWVLGPGHQVLEVGWVLAGVVVQVRVVVLVMVGLVGVVVGRVLEWVWVEWVLTVAWVLNMAVEIPTPNMMLHLGVVPGVYQGTVRVKQQTRARALARSGGSACRFPEAG